MSIRGDASLGEPLSARGASGLQRSKRTRRRRSLAARARCTAAWREGGVHSAISTSSHHSQAAVHLDRKSTRLNSSHANISYAVFCLKKKKKKKENQTHI